MLVVLVERSIPAVKLETKKAEPIVPEDITKSVEKIAPIVAKKIVPEVLKK